MIAKWGEKKHFLGEHEDLSSDPVLTHIKSQRGPCVPATSVMRAEGRDTKISGACCPATYLKNGGL